MMRSISLSAITAVLVLSGCAVGNARQAEPGDSPAASSAAPSDAQRIADLQRQLAERQRHCNEDKRRQELALKDAQKRNDELQKKLDSLLAIDRELRSRGKDR